MSALFVLPSQASQPSQVVQSSPSRGRPVASAPGHRARGADLAGSVVVAALVAARGKSRRRGGCPGTRAAVKELPLPPGKLGNAMMDLLKFLGRN